MGANLKCALYSICYLFHILKILIKFGKKLYGGFTIYFNLADFIASIMKAINYISLHIQKLFLNKKVYLRERKRHTDRGVSSTPYAVLSGGGGG